MRVDFVTFKIVDKKLMKRTAIQEQVIFPLRAYDYVTSVAGKKDGAPFSSSTNSPSPRTRCWWWRCTRKAVADTRHSPWKARTS